MGKPDPMGLWRPWKEMSDSRDDFRTIFINRTARHSSQNLTGSYGDDNSMTNPLHFERVSIK
jgi:hypothetical protein